MEQNIAPENQIKDICMSYNPEGFNRTEAGWYPTLSGHGSTRKKNHFVFQAIRLLYLSSVHVSGWSLHYASH